MNTRLRKRLGALSLLQAMAGVGRADVGVFNPSTLGNTAGGTPRKIMSFLADTPRALAVSPDRNTPCNVKGKTMPGGRLGPQANAEGKPAPKTGLLVKFNRTSGHCEAGMRALAVTPGQQVTYTCVPPGSGAGMTATY